MVAFDTTFPADTLEFCPHPDSTDILLCGTYLLDPEPKTQSQSTQHRRGQLLALQVPKIPPVVNAGNLRRLHAVDLAAVLDIKWSHTFRGSHATVAAADSEGKVSCFDWDSTSRSLTLTDTVHVTTHETLCLAMDWSDRRTTDQHPPSLVVSLSNGSLSILRPTESTKLGVVDSWTAHDYEPWAVAWNYWDTNVIYSGGDDLILKAWDTRQGFDQPCSSNRRFEAGVTSIQNHPYTETLLAVGSYNNSVQLFDTRQLNKALCNVDVGGGAWRVKWHPLETRKNDLLVACMHDGFKVINFGHDFTPQITKSFTEHESLAYGVGWSYSPTTPPDIHGESLIGSCSFYDHALHLWTA